MTTTYVECGCSRRYTPAQFLSLAKQARQDVGDGTYLRLANCVCGSTISMTWCGLDDCDCGDVLNHGIADARADW